MAGRAARLTVPSAVIASLPTFLVSGTCLASTTIFKLILIKWLLLLFLSLLVFRKEHSRKSSIFLCITQINRQFFGKEGD